MAEHNKELDFYTTKKYLRKQTLATILDQFDDRLMNLNKTRRKAKYVKMKQDPYSFFRGSAYLFYYDVVNIPFRHHTPEDRPTWIMGDMHMENFSSFQNENGEIVFDVDDFDEGYLGSYLYDVLRMVVSIRLFAMQQGFNDEERDAFVRTYLNAYYKRLKQFKKGKKDPVKTQFTSKNTKQPIKKTLEKLEDRKATHELDKQTFVNDSGDHVFEREKSKLDSVTDNEYQEIIKIWDQYLGSLAEESYQSEEHYEIKDIVKKTGAGIGSTGLKRFYILIEGGEDHVILEAKEARTPIPAYFFPYEETFWKTNKHQGKRVIKTQRAMHHLADPYLGYFTLQHRDYYVRERSPYDKDLKSKHLEKPKRMHRTVKTMGKISAKVHARADVDIAQGLLDYHSENEILKSIGDDKEIFIEEMVTWSRFYKERVEEDYELFLEWLKESFE
ncbi:DUF2252 domain-containing protein [Marinococcus halotolerans]|uniref:DUF2252 domain-containing protein n=1 Tax=Marinococcus halotolerans TaxID=301092 RepID=UPI0003B380DC|nr:DUF2252 family protein [Marinococcus halotolerans]